MELILPQRQYYPSYKAAMDELEALGHTGYAIAGATEGEVFQRMEDDRKGRNLPDGYVAATTLWLVAHSAIPPSAELASGSHVQEDEFLGQANLRHSLTDALLRFGGHIGYAVRYSRWNQGLGTALLGMALPYAKNTLGLDKVLLTCNDDNPGSARVIEKNGGVLQDTITNVIGGVPRLTRRYWITL